MVEERWLSEAIAGVVEAQRINNELLAHEPRSTQTTLSRSGRI